MFKQFVKGYKYVGASKVDFKNFGRDIKKFIKDSDAQMFIEILLKKKALCDSFYFDFDVDDEQRITRLFWADPIMIKTYMLFGDMVSFDTTYNMNKYKMVFAPFMGIDHHKRFVTFVAGLVGRENGNGFTWLFKNFIKAMGGTFPSFIITDQDLGIKAGVNDVFGSHTFHRLCMWHIMKKVADKVGSKICTETDFLKDLNAVVWGDDVNPTQFEQMWQDIISKYNLEDNEWLQEIFVMREKWIPAYHRDLFLLGLMRTTSRSESENNFFNNFTNPHLTLVEFYMRFDSAIDAQRWEQSKVIADCKSTSAALISQFSLEKHASEIYTRTVFYELQEELKASMYNCGVNDIIKEDGVEHTSIQDNIKNRVYVVDYTPAEEKIVCACKMFDQRGLLCRHALWVLK